MKKCFKCDQKKPLSEFYRHAGMSDGRLGKCKQCARADSVKYRDLNLEKVQHYDRNRPNQKIRAKKHKKYAQTNRAKSIRKVASARWSRKNKVKRRAHLITKRAIDSWRLKRKACALCGSKKNVHAHHPNYSDPLSVVWLCHQDHAMLHRTIRSILRELREL